MGSLSGLLKYVGYGTSGAGLADAAYFSQRDKLSTLNLSAQFAAVGAGLRATANPGFAISTGLFAADVAATKLVVDWRNGESASTIAGDISAIFGDLLIVAGAGASFLGLKNTVAYIGYAGIGLDVVGLALSHPDIAADYTQKILDAASQAGSSALHAVGSFMSSTLNSLHDYLSYGVDPTNSLMQVGQSYIPTIAAGFGIGSITAVAGETPTNPEVFWTDVNGNSHVFASGQRGSLHVDNTEIVFAANTSGHVYGHGSTLSLAPDSGSYAGVFGNMTVYGIHGSTSINLGGVGTRATVYGGADGYGGYVGMVDSYQSLTLGNWGFSVGTAANVQGLAISGDHANITFAANTTGNVSGQETALHLQGNSNSYAGFSGTGIIDGIRGSNVLDLKGIGTSATVYGAGSPYGYVGMVDSYQSLRLGDWGFSVGTAANVQGLAISGDHANITFAANTTGNISGQEIALHLQGNSNSYAGFSGTGIIDGVRGNNVLDLKGVGTSATVYGAGSPYGYVGMVDSYQSLRLGDWGFSVGTAANVQGLTIFADHATFNFANSVKARVIGNNNTISVSDSSDISVEGGANNINVHGAGSALTVGGNGQFAADDWVNHVNFTQSGNFHQIENSRIEVTGSNLHLNIDQNSTTFIFGSNNNTYVSENDILNYRGVDNIFNNHMSYGGWDGGFATFLGGMWNYPGGTGQPFTEVGCMTSVDPDGNVYYDPIILNLDHKPISTASVETSSALFDVHNDGKLLQTGWGTAGEGYLVDTSNGKSSVVSNKDIVHTFDQLKAFDTNNDWILDSKDRVWSTMKIWVDKEGDALFFGDNLVGLDEVGIKSIDLSYIHADRFDNGNKIISESSFVWGDGSQGQIAQVDFRYIPNVIADNEISKADISLSTAQIADIKNISNNNDLDIESMKVNIDGHNQIIQDYAINSIPIHDASHISDLLLFA